MRSRGLRWGPAAFLVIAATGIVPPSSAQQHANIAGRFTAAPGTLRIERADDRIVTTTLMRTPHDAIKAVVRGEGLFDTFRTFARDHWKISVPARMKAAATIGAPPGTVRFGIPGGDLDADGLADTLDVEVDYETLRMVTLTGRRGTDAKRLWLRRYEPSLEGLLFPVGDVTGDRSADILLVRFIAKDGMGAGSCAAAGCYEAGRIAYAWKFTLMSGRRGSVVWTRTFEGEATIGVVSPNLAETVLVDATNVLVLPFIGGDHNGDGLRDLVIDALDVTTNESRAMWGTRDIWTDAESLNVIVGTHAEVASGRTGKTVFARSQPPTPGAAFLLPAGDAVGSSHTDLLWETSKSMRPFVACAGQGDEGLCATSEPGSLDLEMIDGRTLTSKWTASIDDGDVSYAFALPAESDLTGDGNADMLLTLVREELETGVVSGSDGRVSWTMPVDPDAVVDLIGRGAGDKGQDLLVAWFVVASQPTEEKPHTPLRAELHLSRLDGRTGRLRLHTVRSFSETKSRIIQLIESYVFGDADGDGVSDIAVNRLDFDNDTNALASTVFVESGRTGSRMWSRSAANFATTQPAGRAVGGRHGVLDLRTTDDDLKSSLVDVRDGRTVWSRTDPLPDAFFSVTSADQSGTGGDDQILSRLMVDGGRLFSRIDGVEGRTGTVAWGTGERLPRKPRGKVTGTVRNTSGRVLTDMCVSAFKPDQRPVAFDATTTKGTYTLSRLETGKYKLQFYDCARTGYATRWYKQKPDFKSANLVSVTDGRTTSGIDAVLRKD